MNECETIQLITGLDHDTITNLGGITGCCGEWQPDSHDTTDDTAVILHVADELP